jgi:hypothetical protein
MAALAAAVATTTAVSFTLLGSAAHAVSPNNFASVSSGGSLLAGNGVSLVTHPGTGQYEVTFTSNVSSCAYVASTTQSSSQANLVYTASGHASVDGVFVEVADQTGTLTDGPFQVFVDCGGTGLGYAVVNSSDQIARGTSGVTIKPKGVGYAVTFPFSVTKCAYLATVGDPGNGAVSGSLNVATSKGNGTGGVYVETKNAGGGITHGVPFHLAVVCPTAPSTTIAVVGANGYPARGSALTSSFLDGPGTFVVVTDHDITQCATIATRGQIDKAVPYTPTTVQVYTVSVSNATVLLVNDLAALGGASDNQAFHAAIFC